LSVNESPEFTVLSGSVTPGPSPLVSLGPLVSDEEDFSSTSSALFISLGNQAPALACPVSGVLDQFSSFLQRNHRATGRAPSRTSSSVHRPPVPGNVTVHRAESPTFFLPFTDYQISGAGGFPQFPVPAGSSAGFPVSGFRDVRYYELRIFASRQFIPFSGSQESWRGSSPSTHITTIASSHESTSVVSSSWAPPTGFPVFRTLPLFLVLSLLGKDFRSLAIHKLILIGVVLLRHLVFLGSRVISVPVLTLSRAMFPFLLSHRFRLPFSSVPISRSHEVDLLSVPSPPSSHVPLGNRSVPPDEDILSLCPGESEMEVFRSSEDKLLMKSLTKK